MISPDRIILDIDDPNWIVAHGIARDFRSCTKTVAVGPTLFAAHGPSALQSFQELQLKLVVNVCMCTAVPRLLSTLYQLLIAPGVIALSVMATKDKDQLAAVVGLAEHTLAVTKRVDAPAILAYVTTTSTQRHREIRLLTAKCQAVGIAGVIAAPEDIPSVKSVAKSSLMVLSSTQRPPRDYRLRVSGDAAKMPGITELLDAGTDHVMLNSSLLLRNDVEWTADMAVKELTTWEKQHKSRSIMDSGGM